MSSSPCAACKLLRRKCTPECVFAPHFPPDQPAKFAKVHRVFGASNVAKILKDLAPEQREDAVTSLVYEADARLRDPIYGCVGYMYLLENKLREVQLDLSNAKRELSLSVGPAAFGPFLPQPEAINPRHYPHQYPQPPLLQGPSPATPFGIGGPGGGLGMGLGPEVQATPAQGQLVMNEQQQHQMVAMQHAAMAAREQEMQSGFTQRQGGYDWMVTGAGAPLTAPALLPSRVAPLPTDKLFDYSFAVEQPSPPLPQHYAEETRARGRGEGTSGMLDPSSYPR